MIIFQKQFELRNLESIDEASALLGELMTKEELDKKQVTRLRLSLETAMLRWQENDESGVCRILLEKKFDNIHLQIVKDGVYFDPFDAKLYATSDEEALYLELMAKLGATFKFSYWRGSNYLTYIFAKKKKNQFQQKAALIAAILSGILINGFVPNLSQILQDSLLTPLIDCFLGFLKAIVGPFMFVSVVCGFCNIGELNYLGKIGKVVFKRFFQMIVGSAVIAGAVMFPFIRFAETGENTSNQISAIFMLLINIIPSNFVDAFLKGNVLQIVFMAVLLGLVLLLTRPHSGGIINIIEECNDIFKTILALTMSLMPVFIFAIILKLILSNKILIFRDVWWLIALFFAANLILFGIQAVVIKLKEQVSPLTVFLKMKNTFIVSMTTCSSISSLPTVFECCENRFGIDEKLAKIGLPLGIAMFKSGSVAYNSVLAIYCAMAYDVPITFSVFLMALIVSIVLSIATPPIVGGGIACYALMFSQLGIPLDAISLAVTLLMVTDFLITAFNTTHLQLQMLHISDELKMLDIETLKRNSF